MVEFVHVLWNILGSWLASLEQIFDHLNILYLMIKYEFCVKALMMGALWLLANIIKIDDDVTNYTQAIV